MPIGPFQSTVRASVTTSAYVPAVSGPTSSPFHPSGIASRRRRCGSRRRPTTSCAITKSVGICTRPVSRRRRHSSTISGCDQRVADADALREEERERHRAADEHLCRNGRAARRSRRACRSPWRRRAPRRTAAPHRRPAAVDSTSTSRNSSRPAGVREHRRRADDRRVRRGATHRTPRSRRGRPAPTRLMQNAGSFFGLARLRSAGSRASRRRRGSTARPAAPTRGPTTAGASGTSHPSSSLRRAATGAIEYCGSTLPFGRPRWPATDDDRARAPAASRSVGSAVVMRRSSSTTPSRNGTLKSTRTSDPLPALQGQVLETRQVDAHRVADRRPDATRRRTRRGRRAGWSSPTRCRTSRAP